MNVVGRVGSLISAGVYSVATPFHPFGGAVDVIVVEQQDGTYRSTPWYVRFGKFQGVLKGTEKIVRIAVNGVEANFHMYLDNSGEAYFIREVESDAVVKDSDEPERNDDSVKNNVDSTDDANVSICRNDSDVSNTEDECVSLGTDQIDNNEADSDSRLFDFQDQEVSNAESVGSPSYKPYHYDRLNPVEDAAESQASDSEVILFSVDGHVLTAPISATEETADNLQLVTPQFHLGPGEGADFNGETEEFCTDQDAWAAEYLSDIDVPVTNRSVEVVVSVCHDRNAFENQSESCKIEGELVSETQEIHILDSTESSTVKDISSADVVATMNRRDVFKSCLELTDLSLHVEDSETQDVGSPCMEARAEENVGDSQENSPSTVTTMLENEDDNKGTAESPPHKSESPSNYNSLSLSNDVDALEKNALGVDNSDFLGSDTVSLHSVNNDLEWKDEQFVLTPESRGGSSPGRFAPEQDCSNSDVVEPQAGNSDLGMKSSRGMGFEISLCGSVLRAGMGLGPASEAFETYRISEEDFKASASSITKDGNLIVRYKEKYLSWEKAAPVVLGIAAFGLDILVEPKDVIPIEQEETPKHREDAPVLTPSSSGRRWRLWPMPFRRVKTLQHTTSNASNEEVFVDSESGSQNPREEPTPSSTAVQESPRKKLVRTNIPTTEQIATLNLREGQNMITFSFSTRVLGTQQVDAHIYLWKWNARIVISDVDGTITKSDVLGQFMPLVGKDWTQSGVARLFSAIKENGYQLLFLSARAIVQAYLTRSFLLNIKQDGKTLPNGPVVISPDGLFPSLYREVIRRAPHEFKIACLEDIKALFPSDYNPFYAGFGNRDTDELSYRKIGIPKGKIFIINPKGEVAISHRIDVKSYTSLHTLVNDMFPPTSLVEQEDYNSWNYWKMPLPTVDF